MRLNWFDTNEAQNFGRQLAERFCVECAIPGKGKGHADDKKQERLVHAILSDLRSFLQTHKPNAFKKARLIKSFSACLQENGHDDELAERLTREMILAVSFEGAPLVQ